MFLDACTAIAIPGAGEGGLIYWMMVFYWTRPYAHLWSDVFFCLQVDGCITRGVYKQGEGEGGARKQ